MAKFFGKIGYVISKETAPDVWENAVEEVTYRGDVLRNNKRSDNGAKVNDDISLNNLISIVADAFAYSNFASIKYVDWMGVRWKVTNVEIQRPRLILTIGGMSVSYTHLLKKSPGGYFLRTFQQRRGDLSLKNELVTSFLLSRSTAKVLESLRRRC